MTGVSLPAPAAARAPLSRPPLVRPTQGRVLGGVAAGLAAHLGLPVLWVRVALAVSNLAAGAGALLYVWLWALVPSEHGDDAGVAGVPGGPGGVGRVPAARGSRTAVGGRLPVDALIGVALLLLGGYVLAVRAGWPTAPGVVVPLSVVAVGAVVAFSQLDEVERTRWASRAGVGTRSAAMRVVGGLGLVVVGVLLIAVRGTQDVAQLGSILGAAVAVLGGVVLVLAPWGVRLWRDLDAEHAARAREAERADIAAHLHDSVLQTLALIQRRSADPVEVARLARAQERDLRGWLYGGPPAEAATVAAAVAAIAADAEDLHGVVVEVVTVGDRPLDPRSGVLLAAVREAVQNAARHAAGPVRVYVECGPDGVEAFVRDRGPGFLPESVPAGRLGVRESIVGRMERHGGRASVVSELGTGTEVRLSLPDLEEGQ